MNILLLVMLGWNELIDPFVENFSVDLFHENYLLIGGLVLLFFIMFILSLRFSSPLIAIIMIPILFWVNSWAGMQNLLVIAGVILGGIIGAALLKWYNKR